MQPLSVLKFSVLLLCFLFIIILGRKFRKKAQKLRKFLPLMYDTPNGRGNMRQMCDKCNMAKVIQNQYNLRICLPLMCTLWPVLLLATVILFMPIRLPLPFILPLPRLLLTPMLSRLVTPSAFVLPLWRPLFELIAYVGVGDSVVLLLLFMKLLEKPPGPKFIPPRPRAL